LFDKKTPLSAECVHLGDEHLAIEIDSAIEIVNNSSKFCRFPMQQAKECIIKETLITNRIENQQK
jgi:hypothetical protein